MEVKKLFVIVFYYRDGGSGGAGRALTLQYLGIVVLVIFVIKNAVAF